jgi:mannonate dehydratase
MPDEAFTEEHLRLAKQFGCEEIVVARPERMVPGENGRWEYDDLAKLRDWIESFGLRIGAITNLPYAFWDKVRLGLPGREAQMENFNATVRAIGQAGIPILTYAFRPDAHARTHSLNGRGGAEVTAFDRAKLDPATLPYGREFDAAHMWEAYTYFITRAIPVAEAAGVRLAVHPDDPPGIPIGGVARIFSTLEDHDRASQICPSPAWATLLCAGCWAEHDGSAGVLRAIRHFGARDQIAFVHIRDVQGESEAFNECFFGEGRLELTRTMLALKEVGFTGFVIDDHAPRMEGDVPRWNARTRAYQSGYLQGVLRTLDDLDTLQRTK